MNNDIKNNKYNIKVLTKVFRIFDLFSESMLELSATEIVERLSYSQTTVFRIISNLEEEGYLEKSPETGKYQLGLKLFLLGNLVKPYQLLKANARPLLLKLNRDSNETVHLGVLHQYQTLYLDKLEGRRTVRVVVSQVGQKLRAHCSGIGKVLLAHQPLKEVKNAIEESGLDAYTPNTITSWNRFQAELEKIRKEGFAIDNEEIEVGLKCMAAPVFQNERVVAAISMSVPKERFDQKEAEYKQMVIRTANQLSELVQDSMQGFVLPS